MRKHRLTALGVLILGSSVAFASPQQYRSNFNDQHASQMQQEQHWNRGANDQHGQSTRQTSRGQSKRWRSNQQQRNRRTENRPTQYQKNSRHDRRYNGR